MSLQVISQLPQLPPRPEDSHKGTFGRVLVVGGSRGMTGAVCLAGLGALRGGAGLVTVAAPASIVPIVAAVETSYLTVALPEDEQGRLNLKAQSDLGKIVRNNTAMAVGPGLGQSHDLTELIRQLYLSVAIPMVIDADALNALSHIAEVQRDFRAQAVLTPHPGEYNRLAAALRIEADPVDPAARPAAAQELARRLGCVVVLKGPGTVVSDGINTWTNTTGNVALATAGTGDVLCGAIAALIAQHFTAHQTGGSAPTAAEHPDALSLYDCARLGVYLHGLAADRWAARHGAAGMLALDLADEIPDALAQMRPAR